MLRIGKVGMATVVGLMLSLTLLISGAFADDTTTAQNSAGATTRNAIVTGDIQQGTQQMLPLSSTQVLKNSQTNVWRGRHYCRIFPPRRFYRRTFRRSYRRFYRRTFRRYGRFGW